MRPGCTQGPTRCQGQACVYRRVLPEYAVLGPRRPHPSGGRELTYCLHSSLDEFSSGSPVLLTGLASEWSSEATPSVTPPPARSGLRKSSYTPAHSHLPPLLELRRVMEDLRARHPTGVSAATGQAASMQLDCTALTC